MSKYNDDFSVNYPIEDVLIICKSTIAKLGWAILEQSSSKIRCKETGRFDLNKTNFFADVEIVLSSVSNSTKINLNGSNFGLGPFASKHIQGEVQKLKNMIEVEIGQFKNNQTGQSNAKDISVASELEKLGTLRSQGILSDEEFKLAKNKLLGI